jgi:hypothetical protein
MLKFAAMGWGGQTKSKGREKMVPVGRNALNCLVSLSAATGIAISIPGDPDLYRIWREPGTTLMGVDFRPLGNRVRQHLPMIVEALDSVDHLLISNNGPGGPWQYVAKEELLTRLTLHIR